MLIQKKSEVIISLNEQGWDVLLYGNVKLKKDILPKKMVHFLNSGN
jgi:hypothetical protein